MKPIAARVVLSFATSATAAVDGSFTARPTVARDGAGSIVRFNGSRACDVAVSVDVYENLAVLAKENA